jgi:hypothetical protein
MRRLLLLLTVAVVMAAMMVASAMPAFAHATGPCVDPVADPTTAAEPGHSEFAQHHIVPRAKAGQLGEGGHIPGKEHQGFSACNPSVNTP